MIDANCSNIEISGDYRQNYLQMQSYILKAFNEKVIFKLHPKDPNQYIFKKFHGNKIEYSDENIYKSF